MWLSGTFTISLAIFGAIVGWILSMILRETRWDGIMIDVVFGIIGSMSGLLLYHYLGPIPSWSIWVICASFAMNFVFFVELFVSET